MFGENSMIKKNKISKLRKPAQKQNKKPGVEAKMHPKPISEYPYYKGSDKLLNKVAIVTGGDSGIGRAVSISYAIEGADVVIVYLNEHADAKYTKKIVESKNRKCLILSGDVSDFKFCETVVRKTIKEFKKIDILVNNSAEQHPHEKFEDITIKQF
jgi:NADP-dependent 3-hydroxy acid dehydrogenase YdfG